ncbi:hypothetical protein SAMN05444162_3382 [Paenibacillaceae bacterium GAS479]|nr:hypothetical protein SAMN05444162_3382 [Paenibacillaceae bacterium GAS479]
MAMETAKRRKPLMDKDYVIYGWAAVIATFITPLILGIIFAVAGVICGYHVKKRFGRDTMGVAIMVASIAALPFIAALKFTMALVN